MADEFDASTRIAGFSLVRIKKALGWVGVMDDRDDLRSVSQALGCGPRQAARVLEELEHRGFVTRTKTRNQWTKTDQGRQLAHYWHPPRRFRPAVERDDKNSPINQGLEDVTCLLLRSTEDDEDQFEEARIDAAFWTEYEGDHLVEVSVTQPDDYDDPDGGGGALIELSAYLSPANARTLAAGLQKAAEMAEAEIERRAKHPPKQRPLAKKRWSPPAQPSPEEAKQAAERVAAKEARHVESVARKRYKDTVKATLAELRGGGDTSNKR